MLSIFAADLSKPTPPAPCTTGPAFCSDSIAMIKALAQHFDSSFADIEAQLREVMPRSRPRLLEPDGWALFGQFIGAAFPEDWPPFRPVVH